jgi:hypothetical protein
VRGLIGVTRSVKGVAGVERADAEKDGRSARDGRDAEGARLEGQKLFIDLNGSDGPTLTSSYVPGTRFTASA